MTQSTEHDCIVVGGGPAGATAATLLAQHGRKVLLLERGKFPRHHVGESLVPQTYWAFKRLGVLDKLKSSAYPRKQSVQFVSADGKESLPFYFTDRDPGEWSTTWQVRRDEFDQMMLQNARENGVEVRENVRVTKVLFEGTQAVGVAAVAADKPTEIRAKVIVDATGMTALLSNQLRIREPYERLKSAAIYGYYQGAHRDEGRNAGATIILHMPERKGWFWFIPLSDDLTSVGVVAPPAYLCTGRGDDPAATLAAEIADAPGATKRLEHAKLVSKVYVTSDFSYHSKRMAGDGWLLIGDAFGFLDPVYSSGVMLALKSGEYAADAIHAALQANDVSAARLGCFADRFFAGMELLRKMVFAFYDPDFSFGKFGAKHPEYKDHLVRLLIGDVFNDEVGAIFDVMAEWTDLPETARLEGSSSAS